MEDIILKTQKQGKDENYNLLEYNNIFEAEDEIFEMRYEEENI